MAQKCKLLTMELLTCLFPRPGCKDRDFWPIPCLMVDQNGVKVPILPCTCPRGGVQGFQMTVFLPPQGNGDRRGGSRGQRGGYKMYKPHVGNDIIFFGSIFLTTIQKLVPILGELCGKFQMRFLTIQSYRMLLDRWRTGIFFGQYSLVS